jgi:hypothetical protein
MLGAKPFDSLFVEGESLRLKARLAGRSQTKSRKICSERLTPLIPAACRVDILDAQ